MDMNQKEQSELRLRALQLAIEGNANRADKQLVERAQTFYDFLAGVKRGEEAANTAE